MELRVCSTCRQVHPGLTSCPGCKRPLTLADEQLFLGETFGKYRLESVLGAGGMGVVYRAVHLTLKRQAAVKIVLPHLEEGRFQRRFLREAQVLAELKHPNIVEVYDFDVSSWGSPYYVMEYLEGVTVGAMVRSGWNAFRSGAIGAVMADVAAGLAFAHRKGVVHRDLKPENLFVTRFDASAVTKVLDFGIAKLMSADPEAPHLTRTGHVMGTPNYFTPEQLLGDPVGPWTDQYALALIVGELLRGEPVRAGMTLGQIMRDEIVRPLGPERLPAWTPEPLRQALQRATAPRPERRFADVTAFVAGLALPQADAGALARAIVEITAQRDQPTLAEGAEPAAPLTGTAGLSVGVSSQDAPENQAPDATEAMTASVTRGETGARRVRRRRLPRSALAVAALVTLAAAVGLVLRRGPADTGSTAGSVGVVYRRSVGVPPDVIGILSQTEDALVLQGGGAIYLLPRDGSLAPTRVPLGERERVLAPAADGGLWLLQGSRVIGLDPVQQHRTPLVDALALLEPLSPQQRQERVVIAPSGGRLALVQPRRIDVCAVQERACRPIFSVGWDPAAELRVRLTEKYLVVSQSLREVAAYDRNGKRVLRAPFAEQRVHSLAVLDDADLLAVGGWFDHVDVHGLATGGRTQHLAVSGGVNDLAWIADHPTLVMGGDSGLSTWSGGDVESIPWGRGEHQSSSLLATGALLASLDVAKKALVLFDHGSLPAQARTNLAHTPLWAVESDATGQRIFVGGSDGALYVHQPDSGQTEKISLHSGGITDLARHAEQLTSTSDDKTIAVWQLPRVGLIFRSKAHDFLVNQMAIEGDPPRLWSASSDGTLKRWSWPQLEAVESVDTSRVLGRKYSLHALWVEATGTRVLAGTWNHALLVFHRPANGPWQGRAIAVAPEVLYRAAGLSALDAVALAGLTPHGVYLFDLKSEKLLHLRSFGHAVYAAVAAPGGREFFVVGEGCILRYACARDAAGALTCSVAAQTQTRLGVLLAGTFVAPRQELVAVSGSGDLVRLGAAALADAPLAGDAIDRAP